MEIDEHLKYTLYVLHLLQKVVANVAPVCNSTPARALASRWFREGLQTTSCKLRLNLVPQHNHHRGELH
jgi:hypothetical protein